MKVFIYILLLLAAATGCSRGKYYVSDLFRKGDTCSMKLITLDSSYQFYLREVYMTKNEKEENILESGKTSAAGHKRIEVEYLLLSWAQKRAIYISTIPDKYQHYYSSCFTADTLLNAYDFSTFHFGTISDDGESVEFSSPGKHTTVTWDIRPFIGGHFPEKISVREIIAQQNDMVQSIVLVNKALDEPLTFTHKRNFSIVFNKPDWKGDSCYSDPSALCRMTESKIYINQMKKGFDIFFCFDKKIGSSKDSVIRFDYHRTRSTPSGQAMQ